MDIKRNYEYLLSDLKSIKGVGLKTSNLLKRKKINSIFDLLWKLPKSYTDRSLSSKIKDLKIDDNNLYNFYNGLKTNIEFEDNKINKLFKNFKY